MGRRGGIFIRTVTLTLIISGGFFGTYNYGIPEGSVFERNEIAILFSEPCLLGGDISFRGMGLGEIRLP